MPKIKRTNNQLRGKIIAKTGSQADYAQMVGCDPSKISHILANRRKLTPEEAYMWQKLLDCPPEILAPVTRGCCGKPVSNKKPKSSCCLVACPSCGNEFEMAKGIKDELSLYVFD